MKRTVKIALLGSALAAGGCKAQPAPIVVTAEAAELAKSRARVAELEAMLEGRKAGAPWQIVNFHDHVYKMEHAERYVAAAKAVGIAKTVVVGSPKYTIFGKGGGKTEGFDENFQEILRIVRRWPDHFIPFSSVDTGSDGALAMLKRHREQGAVGLKLYNGHGHFHVKEDGLVPERLHPIFEFLRAERMPLLWHVGLARYGEEFEEQVLKRYPDLTVVVAHYGQTFWRPRGKAMRDIPRMLEAYPNLHFDTSLGTRKILVDGQATIAKHRRVFRKLMTRFPDRFLMGSDLVITGNKEKTVSWMAKVLWAVRDQLEKDEFTFDLAARWSTYHPKQGVDADGRMKGLGLPAEVLEKMYVTTPAKLLGPSMAGLPAPAPAPAATSPSAGAPGE